MPTGFDGQDSSGRFYGLAESYARFRPDYPDGVLDLIIDACGLVGGNTVVDLGSGTGISSRRFAARGFRVIGIEPSAEMRFEANLATVPADAIPPKYHDGTAEATGLASNSANLVVAAQSFHWFDANLALREAHRVLKPGGGIALLWNERDASDPFTAAYGDIIRSFPGAVAVELARRQAGEGLFATPFFETAWKCSVPYCQILDQDQLIGRAFSASYAPRDQPSIKRCAELIRQVFQAFQQHGAVSLRYQSSVYLAHRANLPSSSAAGTLDRSIDDDP